MFFPLGLELHFYALEDGKLVDSSDEQFDDFCDTVLEQLHRLEDVTTYLTDVDISASLTERRMSIYMRIEADTRDDAAKLFLTNARCALHAAEGATPNWPSFEPKQQMNDTPVLDLASA